MVAAQLNFAWFAIRHRLSIGVYATDFGARNGTTTRAGHCLGAVLGVAHRSAPAAFRQAVSGCDIVNAQFFAHAGDQNRRYVGRPSNRDAQGRNVKFLELRVRQHAEEQCGWAWQETDFFLRNAVEHSLGFKHLFWIHRCALNEGCHPTGFVAKRVKERIHNEVAIVLLQAHHAAPSTEGANGRSMCSHDTFGPARGTRSEHQIGCAIFSQIGNSASNFGLCIRCGRL